MTKKKIILLVIGIVLVVGGIVGYKFYSDFNEKTKNAGQVEADYVYSSEEFLEKFESFGDDEKARKYFDDKVIRISGTILSIEENQKTFDVVFSTNEPSVEMNFNLIEDMKDKVKEFKSGDEITLQGFYTGKNSSEDMMIEMINYEFNRAVIID